MRSRDHHKQQYSKRRKRMFLRVRIETKKIYLANPVKGLQKKKSASDASIYTEMITLECVT